MGQSICRYHLTIVTNELTSLQSSLSTLLNRVDSADYIYSLVFISKSEKWVFWKNLHSFLSGFCVCSIVFLQRPNRIDRFCSLRAFLLAVSPPRSIEWTLSAWLMLFSSSPSIHWLNGSLAVVTPVLDLMLMGLLILLYSILNSIFSFYFKELF